MNDSEVFDKAPPEPVVSPLLQFPHEASNYEGSLVAFVPSEILNIIYRYLTVSDLGKMHYACKKFLNEVWAAQHRLVCSQTNGGGFRFIGRCTSLRELEFVFLWSPRRALRGPSDLRAIPTLQTLRLSANYDSGALLPPNLTKLDLESPCRSTLEAIPRLTALVHLRIRGTAWVTPDDYWINCASRLTKLQTFYVFEELPVSVPLLFRSLREFSTALLKADIKHLLTEGQFTQAGLVNEYGPDWSKFVSGMRWGTQTLLTKFAKPVRGRGASRSSQLKTVLQAYTSLAFLRVVVLNISRSGVDPDAVSTLDDGRRNLGVGPWIAGGTALHVADLASTTILLQYHANVNKLSLEGYSPLLCCLVPTLLTTGDHNRYEKAAINKDKAMLLIAHGAKLTQRELLCLAVWAYNSRPIAEMIPHLRHNDLSFQAPLRAAIYENHTLIANALYESLSEAEQDAFGKSGIASLFLKQLCESLSTHRELAKTITTLLTEVLDSLPRERWFLRPLEILVSYAPRSLFGPIMARYPEDRLFNSFDGLSISSLVRSDCVDLVEKRLPHLIPSDITDSWDTPPLRIAVLHQNEAIFSMLVTMDSSVRKISDITREKVRLDLATQRPSLFHNNVSPLAAALTVRSPLPQLVGMFKTLVDIGANILAPCALNNSVLFEAVGHPFAKQLVPILLEHHKALLQLPDADPALSRFLFVPTAPPGNSPAEYKPTVLAHCLMKGFYGPASLLLAAGAGYDFSRVSSQGVVDSSSPPLSLLLLSKPLYHDHVNDLVQFWRDLRNAGAVFALQPGQNLDKSNKQVFLQSTIEENRPFAEELLLNRAYVAVLSPVFSKDHYGYALLPRLRDSTDVLLPFYREVVMSACAALPPDAASLCQANRFATLLVLLINCQCDVSDIDTLFDKYQEGPTKSTSAIVETFIELSSWAPQKIPVASELTLHAAKHLVRMAKAAVLPTDPTPESIFDFQHPLHGCLAITEHVTLLQAVADEAKLGAEDQKWFAKFLAPGEYLPNQIIAAIIEAKRHAPGNSFDFAVPRFSVGSKGDASASASAPAHSVFAPTSPSRPSTKRSGPTKSTTPTTLQGFSFSGGFAPGGATLPLGTLAATSSEELEGSPSTPQDVTALGATPATPLTTGKSAPAVDWSLFGAKELASPPETLQFSFGVTSPAAAAAPVFKFGGTGLVREPASPPRDRSPSPPPLFTFGDIPPVPMPTLGVMPSMKGTSDPATAPPVGKTPAGAGPAKVGPRIDPNSPSVVTAKAIVHYETSRYSQAYALLTQAMTNTPPDQHPTDWYVLLFMLTYQLKEKESDRPAWLEKLASASGLRHCLANSICTRAAYGKRGIAQWWFHCEDCNFTGTKGICLVCAVTDHITHDVTYQEFSQSAYCDCTGHLPTILGPK